MKKRIHIFLFFLFTGVLYSQQAVLSVTPTVLSPGYAGGTATFTVKNTGTVTMSWTLTDNAAWITVSPTSGTLTPGVSRIVTITYTANTGTARTGIVTVTATGASGSPKTVTVNQAAPLYPVLNVSTTSLTMSYMSGSKTFSITNGGPGTLQWQVTGKPTWATVTPESGYSNSNVITVSCNTNTGADKTGTITIYSPDYGGQTKTVTLKQTALPWKVITKAYDNLGNVLIENINDEYYHWNEYDSQARLEKVSSNTNNQKPLSYDVAYSYYDDDQIQTASHYENITYSYHISRGWLTGISSAKFNETLIYNDNGNIFNQSINQNVFSWPGLSFSYVYDDINRLMEANCTGNALYTQKYTYTSDGGIQTKTYNNGQQNTYYYTSGKHRLDSVNTPSGMKRFTHDSKGNVTLDGMNSVTLTDYDHRNLPMKMVSGSTTYNMVYNDKGERIYKNDEYYLRDETGRELALYDNSTGKIKSVNLYGNGIAGLVQFTGSLAQRYMYIKDHLGSIRQIVASDKSVVSAQDYYAYGEVLRQNNVAFTEDRYKFTEKERDKATDLDYFGARYYNSKLGVWLQVDPLADKYPGWSPFNYCIGNPAILIDPNGLEWYYYKKEGEKEEQWHYHKNTKQMSVWNGEYDENGNKIMEQRQGIVELLSFDGKNLSWLGEEGEIESWIAVSGVLDKYGNTQPIYQSSKDYGPLPEGNYFINPSKTRSFYNSGNLLEALRWVWKYPSWDSYYTPIYSLNGSQNYSFNRNNAYLHGGFFPGSIGCIDLTNANANFFARFQTHNKKLSLKVKY